MEKIITYENLRNFAYSNDRVCEKPIKGIAVEFFGLGGAPMYKEDGERDLMLAGQGIIYLKPYQNPWAWQNRQNVAFTDELLDVLFDKYSLPDDLPIVSAGGSMGGLSALVYMVCAKRTPAACVANCPVCDLPFHFTERPDLPRTLYSAFFNYDCSLREALESASPLHLADRMPKESKYIIFHCEEDKEVDKSKHSDRFVERMKKDHDLTYYEVPGRGHCDLTDDMKKLYYEKIIDSVIL